MTTLRDPFDHTYEKGGFTYVSWSQVADRLDEAAPGWSFEIRQLGEDWCWGKLTIGTQSFDNIGYAENASADWKKEPYKDAVSDSLKRCAAMAGVGRYLYDKEAPQTRQNAPQRPQPAPTPIRSSAAIPDDIDDIDFDSLPTVAPRAPLSDGESFCPNHELHWILKPAGVSKATGKEYAAFWACPSNEKPFCKEKPTRQWVDAHQPVAVA